MLSLKAGGKEEGEFQSRSQVLCPTLGTRLGEFKGEKRKEGFYFTPRLTD